MRPKVLFSYILLCLIWGSTWFILKKSLTNGTPPFFGSGMRFLLAGSILWIIIFFQKNYPPFSKPALRIYFQFGVLNLAISYGLTYWATQYIYSSLSSIIWSGFPLTVALFSYFMLPNEILTKKKVLSLALGSIGAASILIESINLSGENVTIGVVLVILAVIIASYPSVYLKKYNQIVSSLHINSVSQLMAGIILLSVSYFIENDQQMIWSNYNIFALIYLTIPGSFIFGYTPICLCHRYHTLPFSHLLWPLL